MGRALRYAQPGLTVGPDFVTLGERRYAPRDLRAVELCGLTGLTWSHAWQVRLKTLTLLLAAELALGVALFAALGGTALVAVCLVVVVAHAALARRACRQRWKRAVGPLSVQLHLDGAPSRVLRGTTDTDTERLYDALCAVLHGA